MMRLLIIGGGLAGMMAALRATQIGWRSILVDLPPTVSAAKPGLGGFARFSGAKFSFPPAGTGLAAAVGQSHQRLDDLFGECAHVLGLERSPPKNAPWPSRLLAPGVFLRPYESVLLRPEQITQMLDALQRRVEGSSTYVVGECTRIQPTTGGWAAEVTTSMAHQTLEADVVLVATGRASSSLLSDLGLTPTVPKGLDVGFRVECQDSTALAGLRELGVDAKVMRGAARTFCLNVPGQIFRYGPPGLRIAGGIATSSNAERANVGLLHRLIGAVFDPCYAAKVKRVDPAGWPSSYQSLLDRREILDYAYGPTASTSLIDFATSLGDLDLVDWRSPHQLHFPLLDWHWPVFGRPGTFATEASRLYVAGDLAGHARGLLQAAVSGWAAAKEATS